MQLGSFEIEPKWIASALTVFAIVAFLIYWWNDERKKSSANESIAQAEGWKWIGKAPGELREALGRLEINVHWSPGQVMMAPAAGGDAYLFRYTTRKGSQSSYSQRDGIACLMLGTHKPSAPIYEIGQFPPGSAMRSLVSEKADLLDGVGSPAFQKRYYVTAPGYVGNKEKDQPELEEVEWPAALEKELLSWSGALANGLPDGWSSMTIRNKIVRIQWASTGDQPPAAWRALLTKCEKISQVLSDG